MTKRSAPSQKTVLITGASAGIGAAIAREYAKRGWDLVLVARRETPMAELAAELKRDYSSTSFVYAQDLANPAATQLLLQRLADDQVRVDGLVNNAGYGAGGRFDERAWEDHARFLQLMLHLPVELTHALLPSMRGNQFGRIINVASVAGFLPGVDDNNMYNAVKGFLIKFSQNIHAEMSEYGVHVSALCPGFTHTEFHAVAEDLPTDVETIIPEFAWLDAAEVAEAGVDACERNRPVCVPGAFYKSVTGVVKILPENLTRKILAQRD